MEDFRSQLAAVIDAMTQAGDTPLFLIVELEGAEDIKRAHGAESLEKFKRAAVETVIALTDGADAFTYGDETLVAILSAGNYDRLKTFALIQKVRRSIPLLGQSFDCFLRPECDVLEHNATTGAAGLVNEIAHRQKMLHEQREASA